MGDLAKTSFKTHQAGEQFFLENIKHNANIETLIAVRSVLLKILPLHSENAQQYLAVRLVYLDIHIDLKQLQLVVDLSDMKSAIDIVRQYTTQDVSGEVFRNKLIEILEENRDDSHYINFAQIAKEQGFTWLNPPQLDEFGPK